MKLVRSCVNQPVFGLNQLPWSMDSFLDRVLQNPDSNGRSWSPLWDIREDADKYTLSLETPGFRREELKIEVENQTLTVSGSIDRENMKKSFQRSFTLPSVIGEEGIKATYENGVLQLTFPKREEARSRTISIE